MTLSESDLLREILSEYSLGDLVGYEKLTRGYVNTSYAITTTCDGVAVPYLLRIYRVGIQEEEIVFEHSIIRHLEDKGFDLTASVLPTISGDTYLNLSPDQVDVSEPVFCAVFEYLAGEDRYTWIRPECSDEELVGCASALAQYHDAVCDLTPRGARIEPQILDLLPQMERDIPVRLDRSKGTAFDAYLAANSTLILDAIHHIREAIDPQKFHQMTHLVVHGDYHPGNLKFDGMHVVGLFDLDWSKIDARIFDLGLALIYFCSSWDENRIEDYFELDRAAVFVNAYQVALSGACDVGPLDAVEARYLPRMVAAGNLYVLEWTLRDFYSREVDPQEYLRYLQNHVHLARWLESDQHIAQLEGMITEMMQATEIPPSLSKGS